MAKLCISTEWGSSLRDERLRQGLTQRQLCDISGVAQQTLSVYETGQKLPTMEVLIRLALALNVEPSDLFPFPTLAQLRRRQVTLRPVAA